MGTDFLKKHWRKIVVLLLIVAACIGGYIAGWVAHGDVPAKVVEKTRELTEEELKALRVETVRELTAEEMAKLREEVRREFRRRETTVTTKPDGSSTKHEVETVGIDTTTKEAEVKVVEKVVEKKVVEYVEQKVFVEKVVEKVVEKGRKQWMLSGLVGSDINLAPPLSDPFGSMPVVGSGMLQFRPIGPLWVAGTVGYGTDQKVRFALGAGLEF